jgi:hypothetical protein
MKYRKLILKFSVIALGLVISQMSPTPARAQFGHCPPFAVTCDNGNGGGYCGYQPWEDCTACYGIFDNSVTYGTGCPNPS